MINYLKCLLRDKSGKPRFIARHFLIDTAARFLHQWVSHHLQGKNVVLDIGAKNFPYTKYLPIQKLFGIDLMSESEGYLGWTKENFTENANWQRKIFPIIANAEEMPFLNQSFDAAVMIEVIEHIERDEQAIKEIARVLKKEGILILTTPNGLEIDKDTNPYHLRHYTPESLKALLLKYFQHVDLQILFPFQKLFLQQYFARSPMLKVFWSNIYQLWHFIFGKKFAGGFTLAVIAKNPYGKTLESIVRNPRSIISCPQCKSVFHSLYYCSNCRINFKLENSIPSLLTKTPYHQKGPSL